jgi:hypothetical protein
MTKEVVLKYLQKHGQKIDHEIVKDCLLYTSDAADD